MNAVVTRPRSRKEAPAQLVYKRPEQLYAANTEASAEQRVANLQATLAQADEKLEIAYDAAERGSPADVLLDHIAHNLLCDAMHPVLRNEDEADLGVSINDAEKAREALFTVLAALEGAIALSLGTVIHSSLAEAFILLDWAQDELEDLSLRRLLPDTGGDTAKAFIRGRDLAIELMEEAYARRDEAALQNARECKRWYREGKAQDNFVTDYLNDIIKDRSLIAGFSAILSTALDNDACSLDDLRPITLAETQAGKVGADGTEPYPPNFHGPDSSLEIASTGRDQMNDALGVLESSITVLGGRLQDLNRGAGYGARTLMRLAHERITLAIEGTTTEIQEEASLAFHEAVEVLAAFADEVDDSATWGALTLLELAKEKLDSSIVVAARPEAANV